MEKHITLSKAAELLGVTAKTLRVWDSAGKIRMMRTPGNQRRVPESEVVRLSGSKVLGAIYDNQVGGFVIEYGFCTAYLYLGDWFTGKHIDIREFVKNDVIIYNADRHDCADSITQRLFGEDADNIVIKYGIVEGGFEFPDGSLTVKTHLSIQKLCEQIWQVTKSKGGLKCQLINLEQ
jgi:putative resolvase